MIKILYVIDGLRSGGKERRFLSLLKKIALLENFQCELILFNKDIHYKEIFDLDVKISFISRKKSFDINSFNNFKNKVKSLNPNIIHAWDTLSTLYAILPAKLFNIKLITSKITDAPLKYKKLSKYGIASELCFKYSDLILSNSNAGIKSYRVPIKKSKVIYNGFDPNRKKIIINKSEKIKSFNIKEIFLVGMIANFNKNKDYNTFIKTAIMINKKNKDIGFIVVGDGPFRKKFNNINNNGIYFLGKRNDIEEIIQCCDIGVLLTNKKNHGEGISNSLMEFMAFGKPVIASDNGGNSELINNEHSGYIIEENSPELLMEKIIFLKNNYKKLNNLGENAALRIKNKFNINIMLKSFIHIYKNLK